MEDDAKKIMLPFCISKDFHWEMCYRTSRDDYLKWFTDLEQPTVQSDTFLKGFLTDMVVIKMVAPSPMISVLTDLTSMCGSIPKVTELWDILWAAADTATVKNYYTDIYVILI